MFNELLKEKDDNEELTEEQKEAIKNGDYDPYNFEEEDLEDDDYYFDDDKEEK